MLPVLYIRIVTSSIDNYLELIANEHRREIIRLLRGEGDSETTVDALLDHLCRDDGPNTGPSQDRKQLSLRLHHIHLPKLAAQGVIEYDPSAGTVRYRPDGSLETVMDSVPADLVTVTC